MTSEGVKVIERFFDLPLDYANPQGEKIRVFARNLIPKSKAKTEEEEAKLPYRELFPWNVRYGIAHDPR